MLDLLRKLFSEPEVPKNILEETSFEMSNEKLRSLEGTEITLVYNGRRRKAKLTPLKEGKGYKLEIRRGVLLSSITVGPVFGKGTRRQLEGDVLGNRVVEYRGNHYLKGENLIEQYKN